MPDYTESGVQHILREYDADNNMFRTNSGRCPNHKKIKFRLHYNRNNILQKQILENSYLGATRLVGKRKRGKWVYYLQVNFDNMSPVVADMNTGDVKVALNIQTETVAFCDINAKQGLIELSPSTPRIIEEIRELDIKMDRSRRVMNKNFFNSNGTIKEELYHTKIDWRYSNKYKRLKVEREEYYRILREQRKLNNYTYAKTFVSSANEIILDKNSYKNWGSKHCRMSKKSQERVSNSFRVKDYTKQIHDRAPRYTRSKN